MNTSQRRMGSKRIHVCARAHQDSRVITRASHPNVSRMLRKCFSRMLCKCNANLTKFVMYPANSSHGRYAYQWTGCYFWTHLYLYRPCRKWLTACKIQHVSIPKCIHNCILRTCILIHKLTHHIMIIPLSWSRWQKTLILKATFFKLQQYWLSLSK
jgi:hypothetical protein